MRVRLVPLSDGPEIELKKDLTLVGRNPDCDIIIDHKSVSKIHCILVKTSGIVLLRDLGSTNGTRVNGQRVRRAALLPNDTLAIANYRYKVEVGDGSMGTDSQPISKLLSNDDIEVKENRESRDQFLRRNVHPDVYSENGESAEVEKSNQNANE